MPVIKHRKFNADRFIDKFAGHEPVLAAHLARWSSLAPPNPLTPATFKDYLAAPHENSRDFENMVEGLYEAYDFCTKKGHEFLCDAILSQQINLPDVNDLPREVLALQLHATYPDTFEFARDQLIASQVDSFITYKGRLARPIPEVEAPLAAFRASLGELFKERKGSDQIIIRHFVDGTTYNFIIYHERRVTAELEIKTGDSQSVITTRKSRPVRQDFIAYFADTGRLEIDASIPKERDLMRDTFGLSFFGDASFFSDSGATVAVQLDTLRGAGFSLPTDDGHRARLREVTFKLAQQHGPTFEIRSKDVLATLDLNQLRQKLSSSVEISSAVVSIYYGTGKRAKTVALSRKNSVSFNRSTHARETLDYLRRWRLLAE